MNKQGGVTFVELLFVLVLISVLLTVSLRYYKRYEKNIVLRGVKHDVHVVQSALINYYHIQGCDHSGVFSGSMQPSMHDLGLQLSGRPPMVPISTHAWEADIVNTGWKTANKKPVYTLRVSVHLNEMYTVGDMQWYQKALSAEGNTDHTLFWVILPDQTRRVGAPFWVMQAHSEQFRQRENKNTQYATSSSYCAH